MIDIKYRKIYEDMINHYKNTHVNPWHNISEKELNEIYDYLVDSMDINDKYTFSYLMNYIIKRLSGDRDAHTRTDMAFIYSMNYRVFDDKVYVNYPDELKGSELVSIDGVDIKTIISELDEIITYGTEGRRRQQLERALFDKRMLFSIPSLRGKDVIILNIINKDGERIDKAVVRKEQYKNVFNYIKYAYGNPGNYYFRDNTLVFEHSSCQNEFKEKIEESIKALEQEDLSEVDTIIIDLRGNTGGNSNNTKPLLDFLGKHKDKKLICLTDYRVFSAGRYALMDLIRMGAVTIGEEISTPINCYGNNDWINVEGFYFSASSSYLDPSRGLYASSKEEYRDMVSAEILEPVIFKPDIRIEEDEHDYLRDKDTILEYALKYASNMYEVKYVDNITPIPFLMIVPKSINEESSLLLNMITNDSGTYDESLMDAYNMAVRGYYSPDYKNLCVNQGNPMIIPLIPRCMGLYPGYLGYNMYHQDYSNALRGRKEGWSSFNEEELNRFSNLDEQIVNMIDYATNYINIRYGLNMDDKVIATGYSASSKGVIHFSALHPDRVKMIIAGGTGGLNIHPNRVIDYPLGFRDLPKENLELFKMIPQFYYIGEGDTVDPSRPQFERVFLRYDSEGKPIFKRDECENVVPDTNPDGSIKWILDNGEFILPSGGYYSLEQTHFIDEYLGWDTQKRFELMRELYREYGVNAIFKRYNGNHHIEDETLESDILDFYKDNCKFKKR